ncbi:hypothetical protein AVEN_177904-1 [Araneus ventricosus]|uniref:Uncharacterized protein n=1 Tax=Araneus ventricosus TaxID=182803 RepID=A0A4Y2NI67_ARAVE|nr:hypothetical protein AVEN_177904-1 [Araneus ventricosus]
MDTVFVFIRDLHFVSNAATRPPWPDGKVSTSDRRVPGLNPDSIEEPPCKRVWCTLNPPGPNVLPLVWCGNLERRVQERESSGVVLVF